MAEFNSPEEDHRKPRVRVNRIPQPSPASTPIAAALRLTTSRRLSTTHLTGGASPVFRNVVRLRPVIKDSDSEGGTSPVTVGDGGTSSAGRSVGHSERSALGDLRGWGFQPGAEPSRLGGQATSKRQLDLGGTTRSDGEPDIAREAEAIAHRLLGDPETTDEGHLLETLLSGFKDGSRGYADLLPFLACTLQGWHPSVRSHPLEVDDDATPVWHVPNHKAHTRNVTEASKNIKLNCAVTRDADVLAIKAMSTDKCKCESHQTVTLDAVKELRHARSEMSATGKRDQLNDLVEQLVRRDNNGKRTLNGKFALDGTGLCAKVWQAILKVHHCSV
jgi:hypothetical protein